MSTNDLPSAGHASSVQEPAQSASAIVDVRIHRDRAGRWRARVEGRLVPVDGGTAAEVLARLGLRLEGVAWTERRGEGDVIADARSGLYQAAK